MINGVESFHYVDEHSTDEEGVDRDKGVCYQAERKESKLVGREERV